MSSIISGFEYDIFISYRQKDNKQDGWVTEFVKHLKGEIEATFKEDITIYFDENPNDRLQETHDVSKSLEGKLKCLIFIPILSQTYCDPGSYAWQNEFLVFNRLSVNDQFGKDVKLKNGNFASRILPVRIHDLDPEDVNLFEKETGNVLRTVDFVFRTSSGVNRPLMSNEDHPNDNLNKTFYRDQLNKTANAIKEIIIGLRSSTSLPLKEKIEASEIINGSEIVEIPLSRSRKTHLPVKKIVIGVALVGILIAILMLYPKIRGRFRSSVPKDPDGKISLVVNTFKNLTGDTSLNYMEIGLPNILRGYLGNSSELSVLSTTTMDEVYRSMQVTSNASLTPLLSREAAVKLKAGTYLTGSFQKIGDKTLVQVELNDTKKGTVLMSDTAEGFMNQLNDYKRISATISRKLKNYLEIKAIGNNTSLEFRDAFTSSSEGYRKYIEGMNLFMSGKYQYAIELFKQAYLIDTTFTLAAFYLANANCLISLNNSEELYLQQEIFWTQKAWEGKNRLPEVYQLWIEMWRAAFITKKADDVLNYCDLLEKADIKSRYYYYDIAVTYQTFFEKWDKSINLFQKIESLSAEWGEEWRYRDYYRYFGDACHIKGMHEKEAKIYETGLKLFPDDWWLISGQIRCALSQGDTVRGNGLINAAVKRAKQQKYSQASIDYWLGNHVYLEDNLYDEAEKHFRDALRLEPENWWALYNVASLLIKSGKNVNEGMALIDKALRISPQNGSLIWIKGLGNYKLGNYRQALSLLQQVKDSTVSIMPNLDRDIQNVKDSINRQH